MPSLDQLQKLLANEPQDVFLNFGVAIELARLGRVDESVAQFDRVIGFDANYCPAYFQKGRTFLAAGRFDEAKAALRAGMDAAERAGDAHAKGEMGDLLDSI